MLLLCSGALPLLSFSTINPSSKALRTSSNARKPAGIRSLLVLRSDSSTQR